MTDKQIIEPCMGCSALECWGVVDCDVAQRVLALHKTLTEIKEIVKEQLPTVNYNFAKSMHPEMFNCYEQILQKISEVKDE